MSIDRELIIKVDWIVSLQNSYVEVLTPHVMVFRDGAFGRCLGTDWGPYDEMCPYKKNQRALSRLSLSTSLPPHHTPLPCEHTVRSTPSPPLCHVSTQWREGHLHTCKTPSPQPDNAGTLISQLPASTNREKINLLFKPSRVQYFVMAAWTTITYIYVCVCVCVCTHTHTHIVLYHLW